MKRLTVCLLAVIIVLTGMTPSHASGINEHDAEQIKRENMLKGLNTEAYPAVLGLEFHKYPVLIYRYGSVSEADLETEQCFGLVLWVENLGLETADYTLKVLADGREWTFSAAELPAGEKTWYTLDYEDFPEAFDRGEHECVWYIEGIPFRTCRYSVTEGRSWAKLNDEKLRDELTYEFLLAERSDTTGYLYRFQDTGIVSPDQLRDGFHYVPVLRITNPTEKSAAFTLRALVDGEDLAWEEYELGQGRSQNMYSDREFAAGEHTVEYYINSCYVGAYTFTVLEPEE